MRLEGDLVIHAPRDRAFAQLTDPAFVTRCAPGLAGVREIDPMKRYRLDVLIGLGPFVAPFSTLVEFVSLQPCDRALLRAEGRSHLGEATVTAELRMADEPGGATRLGWVAEARLGGLLLFAVNPLVRALAHARIAEFFECARQRLEGRPQVTQTA